MEREKAEICDDRRCGAEAEKYVSPIKLSQIEH